MSLATGRAPSTPGIATFGVMAASVLGSCAIEFGVSLCGEASVPVIPPLVTVTVGYLGSLDESSVLLLTTLLEELSTFESYKFSLTLIVLDASELTTDTSVQDEHTDSAMLSEAEPADSVEPSSADARVEKTVIPIDAVTPASAAIHIDMTFDFIFLALLFELYSE